jgi:hypothetical protein
MASRKFSPSYGGRPQFSPAFVNAVAEVLTSAGGGIEIEKLNEVLIAKDLNDVEGDLAMGASIGFWLPESGSIKLRTPFKQEMASPSRRNFSRFLHESVLIEPVTPLSRLENWTSMTGLFMWAYSLKLSVQHNGTPGALLIPSKFRAFEDFGTATGVHGEDRIFIGETQFRPSLRWLRAAGITTAVHENFDTVNQAFVYDQAMSVLNEGTNSVRDFIVELRKKCPFLPGGLLGDIWQLEIKDAIGDVPTFLDQPNETQVGDHESLVLRLLNINGVIKLENRVDAGDSMTLGIGTDREQISHLVLSKGSRNK